jgi:hypothetical protein
MTSPTGTTKARLLAGSLALAGAALLPIAPAVASGTTAALPNGSVVMAVAATERLPKCIPPECRYA